MKVKILITLISVGILLYVVFTFQDNKMKEELDAQYRLEIKEREKEFNKLKNTTEEKMRKAKFDELTLKKKREEAEKFHALIHEKIKVKESFLGLDAGRRNEKNDEAVKKRGRLDAKYIRESMQEVKPLIKECYENMLLEKKIVEGTLKLSFSIIGEEEEGGVIENVMIPDEGAFSGKNDFLECLRETTYTLKLDAPKNGGQIEVSYPIHFSSGKGKMKGQNEDKKDH